MSNFIIKQGTVNELDIVKPLWEKLNRLHYNLSLHFKNRYENKTWENRKQFLIEKSKNILFEYVILSFDNSIIGYCISTIEKKNYKSGEIDSIFIEENYRKSGIGKQLMNRAIEWLNAQGSKTQKILVGVGNEEVLEYYKQFDFFPLHIVLQKVNSNE